MRLLMLIIVLTIAACRPDETLSGFADPGAVWRLAEVDGVAFAARATVRMPEPGQISGQGPCNSFSGALTSPYPWFALGPLRSTRMACAEMELETEFFAGLAAMTLAEVSGGTLILSNAEGRSMVFERQD